MIHMDWKAWDAWMEAHDDLVQRGIIPSCEEITAIEDSKKEVTERDMVIAANKKFNDDVRIMEESRLNSMI